MKVYVPTALAMAMITLMCSQATSQDYDSPAYGHADTYVAQARSLEDSVATFRGNLGSSCCESDCCASCCDDGCCDSCCDDACPAIQFWVDATIMRFHKTGGVRVGNDPGEDAELGYFLSPRFNLRYYNSNGMYWQLSYFEFNHGTLLTVGDPGSHLGVRSWTLDAVAGERFMLNSKWTIDWNGGARLYNYSELAVDRNELNNGNTEFSFDHSWGIGGIMGLEATRCLGNGLSAYGAVKLGIVHGDHTTINSRQLGTASIPLSNRRLLDENFIHTEIGSGIEYSTVTRGGTEIIVKAGGEWITYENASSSFLAAPGNEEIRKAGADVGYGGFTFSLGFYR